MEGDLQKAAARHKDAIAEGNPALMKESGAKVEELSAKLLARNIRQVFSLCLVVLAFVKGF